MTRTVFVGPIKMKGSSSEQSSLGTVIVTFFDSFPVSTPLDGEIVTPGKSVVADQLKLPWDPETGSNLAIQVQPLPLLEQFPPAVKLCGSTVNLDGVPQYQGTGIALPPNTENSRLALFGQLVFGTAIVT